jgi:hypothetical protein
MLSGGTLTAASSSHEPSLDPLLDLGTVAIPLRQRCLQDWLIDAESPAALSSWGASEEGLVRNAALNLSEA